MLDTDKRAKPEVGATIHGRAIAANATRLSDKGDDARRFRLAVSSETPVERWYGDEVLVHEREAINLEFFGSGRAPLLLDHDPTRQIGVVEKVSLDGDRVLRATVRFGKGAEAAATMADVEDGIRANVSVGYRINDFKPLPKDAGYRVTDWTPMEVSIVSIPADPSVGVGRSDQQPTKPTHGKRKMNPEIEDDAIRQERRRRADAMRAEDEREAAIHDLATRHNEVPNIRALAAKAIEDGITRAAFAEIIVANLPKSRPLTDQRIGSPALWTGDRSHNEPRVIDAINHMLDPRANAKRAGLMLEMHQEIVQQTGMSARGMFIPPDMLATRAIDSGDVTALTAGGSDGSLFAGSLKARLGVGKLGARVISGASKDFSIPRMLTGTASYWTDKGAAPTESAPSFGAVNFAYKQLSTMLGWTRRTATQSDPHFEHIIRQDMLREIAVMVDRAAINGSGSSGQPRGILNTVGVNAVDFGTNGGALTWAKVLEFIAAVEADNVGEGNKGWLVNSATWTKAMSTPKEDGFPQYLISDETPDRMVGAPVAVTNSAPGNLTKGSGTGLSAVIYGGKWDECIIAQFGGIDIVVETAASTANVTLGIHSSWDIGVRLPEAFCIAKDVVTTL